MKKTPRQIAAKIAAKAADETAAEFPDSADAETYGAATFEEVYANECRRRGIDPEGEE